MKSLFRISILLICFFALCSACTKEDASIDNSVVSALESDLTTRSDISPDSKVLSDVIKYKKITKEFIPIIIARSLDEKDFKNKTDYSIETISRNGRNLMHVVNFDKGGWAIVSGRFREDDLILAYGAEGEFDPGNIESPEVRFWLDRAESMLEQEMIEDEENDSAEAFRSGPYDNEPYVWLKVPLGYQYSSELYESVAPLTTTNWGQSNPWNWLCPVDPNTSTVCPLGCSAVAVSQMLYYLHYEIGVPSGLYHTIDTNFVWIPSENHYLSYASRSNYTNPSNRWSIMQKNWSSDLTINAKHTGRFILDVADRLDTKFASSGSEAETDCDVFYSFGIFCSPSDFFSESYTTNSIRHSMPVLVRANDSNNTRSNNDVGDGHAWIIDGYKINRNTSDYPMYLKIIPTDSLSFYPDLNYDMILTDSQKQSLYPDFEEYEIIHDYSYSYSTLYHMNWGWNGLYYNSYYSSSPLLWNPYPHVFSQNVKMIYGFSEL